MPEEKKHTSIEQEISKQIDNLDRRFDRNGWFFIVLLIIILFLVIYIFMQLYIGPDSENEYTHSEFVEQFESLEERFSNYEERLEVLENQ